MVVSNHLGYQDMFATFIATQASICAKEELGRSFLGGLVRSYYCLEMYEETYTAAVANWKARGQPDAVAALERGRGASSAWAWPVRQARTKDSAMRRRSYMRAMCSLSMPRRAISSSLISTRSGRPSSLQDVE